MEVFTVGILERLSKIGGNLFGGDFFDFRMGIEIHWIEFWSWRFEVGYGLVRGGAEFVRV